LRLGPAKNSLCASLSHSASLSHLVQKGLGVRGLRLSPACALQIVGLSFPIRTSVQTVTKEPPVDWREGEGEEDMPLTRGVWGR
jgi:hypothetical protein